MKIIRCKSFIKNIKKYKKDKEILKRIKNHLKKIVGNPEIGNLLRGEKKGERKIYMPPFRLLYSYDKKRDILYLLDFDHRDIIYKKKR